MSVLGEGPLCPSVFRISAQPGAAGGHREVAIGGRTGSSGRRAEISNARKEGDVIEGCWLEKASRGETWDPAATSSCAWEERLQRMESASTAKTHKRLGAHTGIQLEVAYAVVCLCGGIQHGSKASSGDGRTRQWATESLPKSAEELWE